MRCADRLLAAGSQSKALAVFQRLYDTEKKDGIRTAAYRGMIQASGKRALPLMTAAILGAEGASQISGPTVGARGGRSRRDENLYVAAACG